MKKHKRRLVTNRKRGIENGLRDRKWEAQEDPMLSASNTQRDKLTRWEVFGLSAISVGVIVTVYAGWRLFWFLTDDAYIEFRFVSNSILGYGYVWNAPPFRAVEGYTSFLWVVLLDLVWRIVGIEPPDSANWLSLIFSLLTLPLGAALILRMNLNERLRPYRVLFLALILTGVVTNRTFLAWTSSGLETAMFNFFLTLWVCCALCLKPLTRAWLVGISSAAALAYLTRPDGLLPALVTAFLAGLAIYGAGRRSQLAMSHVAAVSPLAAIPAHLAWRLAVYGEWLPNTYYAKTLPGQTWLQSGLRYLGSFLIEYSMWIWLAALLFLLVARLRAAGSRPRDLFMLDTRLGQLVLHPEIAFADLKRGPGNGPRLGWVLAAGLLMGAGALLAGLPLAGIFLTGLSVALVILLRLLNLSLIGAAVISALVLHFLYYTVIIGGDHFEFRVYSHLVLLLFVSALWLLASAGIGWKPCVLVLASSVILSWPIPWTHWWITRDLTTREQTWYLKASVAEAVERRLPSAPRLLLSYLGAFDTMQSWLIGHGVCMRHQEHKVFRLYQTSIYPTRDRGMEVSGAGYPVFATGTVGVISWVLPRVAILDRLGLNDYVIARNRASATGAGMAHDRRPPPGYQECFAPNVTVESGRLVIVPRSSELTAQRIIECERTYAARMASGS